MSSFSQAYIERRYQQWARVYDWLTPQYLLGAEKRLRKETIALLHLQRGQTILDIACGTGRNFPGILERIAPSGRLVGVDYTGAMLARAQDRIQREGWQNVELIQADAARIKLNQEFDAALSTLAMGVIPDYRSALERMQSVLKPGGWLAVGDAKLSSGRFNRLLNWIGYLLGYGAAEVMTRRPWDLLRETLADFRYTEWFSGFYYVAGGRVPKA